MAAALPLETLWRRFEAVGREPLARDWLEIRANLQAPRNTLLGYGYDLNDFLKYCTAHKLALRDLRLKQISEYIAHLGSREVDEGKNRRNRRTEIGLAPSTMRRRISTVRQFFDYLCGEGICERNPTRNRGRALVVEYENLPWIPDEEEWSRLIDVVLSLSLRNRAMFALNYDTGARKEELCGLWLGDFDHAARTILIRAENTKNRRSRVVPYGSATDALVVKYITTLPRSVRNNEGIFRSESPRNAGKPVTVHTWTKVVESVAQKAGIPHFHAHTLRHLCLTDLARSGWDIREIRDFAGHKSVRTTEKYIHLSGRELIERYHATMTQIHAQRVAMLSMILGGIA